MSPRLHSHRAARGLSLVELLVGITIGLFVLAGATAVATTQLTDNRRLVVEAEVQQDLRLTMDLISRDLRRAAYWGQSHRAVWPAALADALINPYMAISPANAEASHSISFNRSTDEEDQLIIVSENNVLDNREVGGFRYNSTDETIEVQLSSGNWQAMTDKSLLRITDFTIAVNSRAQDVPCGVTCPVLGPGGHHLQQIQRDATIEITGVATSDSTVRRSLKSSVRLRNDLVKEAAS